MALLSRQIEINHIWPDGTLDCVVKAFMMETPFGGYRAGCGLTWFCIFGAQHRVCLGL